MGRKQRVLKPCDALRAVDGQFSTLCAALRDHPEVIMGPSPRASLGLQAAARAKALISGRHYVLPDDVKSLATSILAHRLVLDTHSRIKGTTEQKLVRDVLESVPVPVL